MHTLTPEARLALALLEELALRRGRSRLKYLKSYRLAHYWLGPRFTGELLKRLIDSGYIAVKGNIVELKRMFKVEKSYQRVIKEAYDAIMTLYRRFRQQ